MIQKKKIASSSCGGKCMKMKETKILGNKRDEKTEKSISQRYKKRKLKFHFISFVMKKKIEEEGRTKKQFKE